MKKNEYLKIYIILVINYFFEIQSFHFFPFHSILLNWYLNFKTFLPQTFHPFRLLFSRACMIRSKMPRKEDKNIRINWLKKKQLLPLKSKSKNKSNKLPNKSKKKKKNKLSLLNKSLKKIKFNKKKNKIIMKLNPRNQLKKVLRIIRRHHQRIMAKLLMKAKKLKLKLKKKLPLKKVNNNKKNNNNQKSNIKKEIP